MSNTLSYVHGASGQALIGQTIGRYFDEAAPATRGRRRWWCATRTSA